MRRAPKIAVGVALAIVVLGVAVAALATPLATWRTRKALSGLEGMRARFASVEVHLLALSYEIRGLRIEKLSSAGAATPLFEVERLRVGLYGKELLHGHLVGSADLDRPRLTLIDAKRPAERQSPREAPKVARRLERLTPFRLDRVQVKDGEVRWIDRREPEAPVLRLHGVEATLENFATRATLARHEPTVLAARGTLQRTGAVAIFATADPLAKALTFAGQATLKHLALRELRAMLAAKSDVAPTRGTIDMFVRFEARDGALTGGVRPVAQGADLAAAKDGIGPAIKAFVADAALEIFKDHKTDEVATNIPIEGSVSGAQVQAMPTIMSILRNAFVRGLQGGLSGLPPSKAKKPEGVMEQARRALSPARGQPRAGGKGGK